VWDVRTEQALSREQVIAELARADELLLGELHDNVEHHRTQARVLEELVSRGRRPAVVMEQIDVDWQAAIDTARTRPGASVEDIAVAGHVERKAWDWPLYEPIVELALRHGLPIVAGNLSRAQAMRLAREGAEALPGDRLRALGFEAVWNPERERRLREEVQEAHCGLAPERLVAGLALAQRARDATLAEAMIPHLERGVVAIVGRGHARRDLAVPIYLAHARSDLRVVSVGFVEVGPGLASLRSRLGEFSDGGTHAFDLAWLSPEQPREDPCKSIRPGAFGR
jgi:uncharacterized iron-regulated protein